MAAILENAKNVFADGLSASPKEPNKADIIRLFGLIEAILGSAVSGLIVGGAVVYQTRAALFANLARPADSVGIVYGDSTAAYNGIYAKVGASGSGSWTLTNLALPSTFVADLAAVITAQAATQGEVTAARSGSTTLAARLSLILNTALDRSSSVLDSLTNTIAGKETESQQRDSALSGRIDTNATASQQRDSALGGRIDDVSAARAQTQSEVTSARAGKASLSERLAFLQAEIDALEVSGATDEDIATLRNELYATDQKLSGFVVGLGNRLDSEVAGLSTGITLTASNSVARDTALGLRIDQVAILKHPQYRPGDELVLFSSGLTGPAASRPAFTAGSIVNETDLGATLLVNGASTNDITGYIDVALRADYAIEPGRTYLVTAALRRKVDPANPTGSGIELRWQNLNFNKASVSNVRIGSVVNPKIADGVVRLSYMIGKAGALGDLTYTIPTTAIYGLPLLRLYGNGQQTTIIELSIRDVTDVIGTLAKDKTSAPTLLSEWVLQSFADQASKISVIPRLEAFGSNSRLNLQFFRNGVLQGTVFAYRTRSELLLDTTRPVGSRAVTFADPISNNNALWTRSSSTWTIDTSFDVSNGMKAALASIFAAQVVSTGVSVPGTPGEGVPAGGDPGQLLTVLPNGSKGWQAAAAVIALLGLDGRYPQLSELGYSVGDLVMLAREPALLAHSAMMKRPTNARFARVFWEYNLLAVYGQSLGEGREAWARWVAEDTPTRADTWMIGNSVRPQSGDDVNWTPFGAATLTPLKANVDDALGNIQTPAQVDALPAGALNNGENVLVGATRYIARAFEDARLQARQWVAGSACVGGRSVEALSPAATPRLYTRFEQLLAKFVAAVPTGNSRGVPALVWMQGETNYSGGDVSFPADMTRAGYKAKLLALKDQMNASVAFYLGIAGRPPVMLTYQTGASWTVDTNRLAIGMAQWDASLERSDIAMVGPIYPVTDKGGHLDANGTRWFGQQIGKVFQKVVDAGEDWEPLSPKWVDVRNNTIYVGYHVPEPPLAFDLPYVVNAATNFVNKGFRVTDGDGDIGIVGVRILGACIVAIDLARPPAAAPLVWYAGGANYNGHGCLRDSDPTIADSDFVGTSVPALAAKPYPLQNWSIAYCLPVGWSR